MKLPKHPRIIFMGTPDFAVPALKALVKNGHNILCVVTQPDRPKGRGRKYVHCPVKKAGMRYGLNIFQPDNVSTPEFCKEIRALNPDIVVVVAFGQILKKNFLLIPTWGVLNIHASLLPKYRGAAPIHCAVLNNELKTGLTAMKMDQGLDTGPVLLQKELPLAPDVTAGQLHDQLAEISGPFLLKTLNALSDGQLTQRPQDDMQATYAEKIDRSMSHVKWDQSAQTISALIRALDPWPGAYTTFRKKTIKLFLSRVTDESRTDGKPGRIIKSSDTLEVETGKGIVQIRELQTPGKKRLPAKDFLRGFPLEQMAILD